MNIGIDLTAIPKTKSGVGRYLFNLIQQLQEIDHGNSYYLFIQDDDLDGFNITKENFEIVPIPSKILRNTFIRLLWEQFVLPWNIRKLHIDVFHSPHYTMPYRGKCKTVVTFHDMTFFMLPEVHTVIKRILLKSYIKRSARKAELLLSVSETTAEDMVKILGVERNKIVVTHNGVGNEFFINKESKASAILCEMGIESEYFLYVGTIEPRKNILGILKAYSLLDDIVRKKYKLVICGKKGWMYDDVFSYINDNGLGSDVIFTGFVKDGLLPHLYSNAKLFLYPSFYEGFGIPVIEAMASGIPCITSDIEIMREVCNNAAIRLDPNDHSIIRDAILLLLGDENQYNKYKVLGIERAKDFTWRKCAEKTLEAYLKAFSD